MDACQIFNNLSQINGSVNYIFHQYDIAYEQVKFVVPKKGKSYL